VRLLRIIAVGQFMELAERGQLPSGADPVRSHHAGEETDAPLLTATVARITDALLVVMAVISVMGH
jgi:hypothetical protein